MSPDRNTIGLTHCFVFLVLASKNGKSRDVLGSALSDEKQPRRLGPAHARRTRRSTVLWDAIEERVMLKSTEVAVGERPESPRPTRVQFGEDSVLRFNNEMEVSKLMSGLIIGKKQEPKPATSAAQTRPLKSILKVRLDPVDIVMAPVSENGEVDVVPAPVAVTIPPLAAAMELSISSPLPAAVAQPVPETEVPIDGGFEDEEMSSSRLVQAKVD